MEQTQHEIGQIGKYFWLYVIFEGTVTETYIKKLPKAIPPLKAVGQPLNYKKEAYHFKARSKGKMLRYKLEVARIFALVIARHGCKIIRRYELIDLAIPDNLRTSKPPAKNSTT